MVEEYDAEKHPASNAAASMDLHGDSKRFKKFQQRIRDDDKHALTAEDLQREIDEFLEIDPSHSGHFINHKPTAEQWKQIRHQYIRTDLSGHDDEFDPDHPMWFHNL